MPGPLQSAGDSHKQIPSCPLGVIIQWGRRNKHANRVISDTDHTEGDITVMENDWVLGRGHSQCKGPGVGR